MEPNARVEPPADYPAATDRTPAAEAGDAPIDVVQSLADAARRAGAWANDED